MTLYRFRLTQKNFIYFNRFLHSNLSTAIYLISFNFAQHFATPGIDSWKAEQISSASTDFLARACQFEAGTGRWKGRRRKNGNKFTAAFDPGILPFQYGSGMVERGRNFLENGVNYIRGESQSWLDIFPIVFGGMDRSGKCLDNQDGYLQSSGWTEFPTHGIERKDESFWVPKASMLP